MCTISVFADLRSSLQLKPVSELSEIFSEVSDILEAAAATCDPQEARAHVVQELEQLRERMNVPASNGRKSDGILHRLGANAAHLRMYRDLASPLLSLPPLFLSGTLQTLPLPTAKCYMFHWEKDNFGKLTLMG